MVVVPGVKVRDGLLVTFAMEDASVTVISIVKVTPPDVISTELISCVKELKTGPEVSCESNLEGDNTKKDSINAILI